MNCKVYKVSVIDDMSMGHQWKHTDEGKPQLLEKNQSCIHPSNNSYTQHILGGVEIKLHRFSHYLFRSMCLIR